MTITDAPHRMLGRKLKASRTLAGLDQTQIANELHLSRGAVSGWETGRFEPTFSVLVRWARVTGQPVDWFVEAVNDEAAPAEAGAAVSRARRDSNPQPSDLWSMGLAGALWVALALRSSLAASGCPCRANDEHERGDCPSGCSCNWCAPEWDLLTTETHDSEAGR